MHNKMYSTFSVANDLYRKGFLERALVIYHKLALSCPEFRWYTYAYEKCKKELAEFGEGSGMVDESGGVVKEVVNVVHPKSKHLNEVLRYCIVTPVLNGEQYLARTIDSVLSQKGGFFVDYVIKDGGSTDNTVQIAMDFANRISNGSYPLSCKGIRFSILTGADRGLYDALSSGFAYQSIVGTDMMTYLNADDLLHVDSFEIVRRIVSWVKVADWIIGQPNVINDLDQTIQKPNFPVSYNREDIISGFHDGRNLNFIQQEGSFWIGHLYLNSGGFDRNLRLAGDFDLWRKFAQVTEPLTVSKPLASFRKRDGQLSGNMQKYYSEIDRLVKPQSELEKEELGVQSGISLPTSADQKFIFSSGSAHKGSARQKAGALCFLSDDGHVREIAYLKRSWLAY
jgi:hypothetical protein